MVQIAVSKNHHRCPGLPGAARTVEGDSCGRKRQVHVYYKSEGLSREKFGRRACGSKREGDVQPALLCPLRRRARAMPDERELSNPPGLV